MIEISDCETVTNLALRLLLPKLVLKKRFDKISRCTHVQFQLFIMVSSYLRTTMHYRYTEKRKFTYFL